MFWGKMPIVLTITKMAESVQALLVSANIGSTNFHVKYEPLLTPQSSRQPGSSPNELRSDEGNLAKFETVWPNLKLFGQI